MICGRSKTLAGISQSPLARPFEVVGRGVSASKFPNGRHTPRYHRRGACIAKSNNPMGGQRRSSNKSNGNTMIDLQYDSVPALVMPVTGQKIFAMGPKAAIIGTKAVTVISCVPCHDEGPYLRPPPTESADEGPDVGQMVGLLEMLGGNE